MAEVLELSVDVEGASLLIAEELFFKREPDWRGSGILRQDGLRHVGGDCAGDPQLDDTIHAALVLEVGRQVYWRV